MKKLIGGDLVDVNQLMPFKYPWAWEHYLNGCNNHWLPREVSLNEDVRVWKSTSLTKEQRIFFLKILGFFATGETIVANNLSLALYRQTTAPEVRLFMLRQAFEESVHAATFVYICESLSLNPSEIWEMYKKNAIIEEKDAFELELTRALFDPNFSTDTSQGAQTFLENLIGYYLIMEGIFFYGGFALLFSFGRQNQLLGVCQLYEFILRDETIHLNFGIDLINGIIQENPHLWTNAFKEKVIRKIVEGVALEKCYGFSAIEQGVFGLTKEKYGEFIEYLADRRLERIGLKKIFFTPMPLPWLSEIIDLNKEKNFFEKTVTEYRSATSLKWRD